MAILRGWRECSRDSPIDKNAAGSMGSTFRTMKKILRSSTVITGHIQVGFSNSSDPVGNWFPSCLSRRTLLHLFVWCKLICWYQTMTAHSSFCHHYEH